MFLPLPPPTPGDLAFSALSIDGNDSSNSVTLRYELSHGLACLLKTRPASTETKICTQETDSPDKYCNAINSDTCSAVDLPHDYRSVESFVGTWDSPMLSGDTPYAFTAFVSYGSLVNCTSVQVRTQEGIPSGKPLNVSFSVGREKISSTLMLMLTWLPPPNAERNGNISRYRVLFWNKSDSSPREVIVNGSLKYTEEYDSSRDYSYAIAACTSQGCGPSYNDSRAGGISELQISEGT